jgi:acyl carrier protein
MDKTKDKLDSLFNLIFKIPKSKEKKNLNYKNIKRWDSLNHLNLMLAIESKFNIRIMPEESVDLMSYKKILTFLKTIDTNKMTGLNPK